MIRIDEIYYNVFVKALQDHPRVGLHWFEPFGTTQYENLTSVPSVDYFRAKRRIIFWDQEPLHQERITEFLDKFIPVYKKAAAPIEYPITLVTSEKNSEYVEQVCGTYDLHPEYYFFHGWAALDWYRGYNRTFLIKPPAERRPTRTFIAPNRIIAGQRQHRLEMLYWIFKLGLTDNHISCPTVCPAENISIYDAVNALPFDDAEQVFRTAPLPRQFEGETNHPMHSCWLSLFDQSADSMLYLITETVANGRRLHLTEKTFKPIALGMPFVIVGTQGSLEYLRGYGFKTFGHLWDESYDTIADPHERIRSIAGVLGSLCDLSVAERVELYQAALPTIQHNYNHFYGGGFEAVLWTELQGMLKRVKSCL